MTVYLTAAELKADDRVDDGLADAKADRIIDEVEDLVDRLAPMRRAGANGRRFDLTDTTLSAVQVAGLKAIVINLAVELVDDPAAFDPSPGQSVTGPDFSISLVRDATPRGQRALIRAAGSLDRLELRSLTASARP